MSPGVNYSKRGEAYNINALPPVGLANGLFMQSGGVRLFEINSVSITSNTRQIQNQADWLYFSGHGHHTNGTIDLAGGIDFHPLQTSESVYAAKGDGFAFWHNDLDVLVFSACSVFDIYDYESNYSGLAHIDSPGELWLQTGPKLFMGYNYSAPSDGGPSATGSVTKDIVTKLFNPVDPGVVPMTPDAWMKANEAHMAWYACVIDIRNSSGWKYYYFKRFTTPFIRYEVRIIDYDHEFNMWPNPE